MVRPARLIAVLCYIIPLVVGALSSGPFRADRLPDDADIHQRPVRNIGLVQDARVLNIESGGAAFTMSFTVYGRQLTAEMRRHTIALHPDVTLHIQGRQVHGDTPHFDTVRHAQQNVYDGLVYGKNRRELGWARFLFHRPPDSASSDAHFEGLFTVDDDLHSVRSAKHYSSSRRPIDARAPVSAAPTSMLVFRESDKGSSAVDDDNHRLCSANMSVPVAPFSVVSLRKRSEFIGGTTQLQCGSDNLAANSNPLFGAKSFYENRVRKFLDKQQQQQSVNDALGSAMLAKRGLPGCPTTRKVLYLGMAADCTYVQHYGSAADALKQMVLDVSQASAVYEKTFNVALAINNFDINPTCSTDNDRAWNVPCSAPYTISQRLNDFSQWRGRKSVDTAGVWHLVTTCSSGSTMGIAWMNTLCTHNVTSVLNNGTMEYRTGAGVSTVSVNEWMVVAHEIGHNFGAMHDCTGGTCPCTGPNCQCCPCGSACDCNNAYMMNPTANIQNSEFSGCTANQICSKMAVLGSCLANVGALTVMGENQCGNGVLEAGEECDCGDPNGSTCSNDKCCDGATCKLKPEAKCSEANGLCCQDCQYKPAGLLCRAKKSSCDAAESCTGQSGTCPDDSYSPDGSDCELPGAKCASGFCTSRSLQCLTAQQNVTGACPNFLDQCSLYCSSNATDQCISVSGFFIDGTPCSSNGFCRHGMCDQPSDISVTAWVFIGLGSGCGVALICFGAYLYHRRSRAQLVAAKTAHSRRRADKKHMSAIVTSQAASAARPPMSRVKSSYVPSSSRPVPTEQAPRALSVAAVRSSAPTPAEFETYKIPPIPGSEVASIQVAAGRKQQHDGEVVPRQEKAPAESNTDQKHRRADSSQTFVQYASPTVDPMDNRPLTQLVMSLDRVGTAPDDESLSALIFRKLDAVQIPPSLADTNPPVNRQAAARSLFQFGSELESSGGAAPVFTFGAATSSDNQRPASAAAATPPPPPQSVLTMQSLSPLNVAQIPTPLELHATLPAPLTPSLPRPLARKSISTPKSPSPPKDDQSAENS